MKISVRDPNVESFYPILKEIGYDGVDVSFSKWDQREYILSSSFKEDYIKKYERLTAAGLTVIQTHLTYYPGHFEPLGDGSYEAFEEYMLPIMLQELEVTAMMRCSTAVLHPFFDVSRVVSREGNMKLFGKLLPAAERYGIMLAAENIYCKGHGEAFLTTAEDLLYYTERIESQNFGICLDVGHAVTRKQEPAAMLRALGSRVKALHLHSNVSDRDLHLPPMMVRYVDWVELYGVLENVGYQGAFNMEISPPKQMNRKTAVDYYTMAHGIATGLISKDTDRWMDD